MGRRLTVTLVAVASFCGVFGSAALAGGGADDQNCEDFEFQEDAQEHYDADPSDPDNLDANNDGIACDELPHRPAGATTPTTRAATSPTTAAATAPTTPRVTATTARPTTATTGRQATVTTAMPHTGSETERPTVLAAAAVAFGLALVVISYERTRRQRRMT